MMLSLETTLLFFGINLGLCLIPTPEMVMIVTRSSLQGIFAGMTVIFGICTALLVQVALLALGLTTIIQSSEMTFFILKIVGVLYLSWFVYKQPIVVGIDHSREFAFPVLYRHGFMLNLSNPANPLFLLVFFPPFIEPSKSSVISQIFQLGTIMIIAALIMFSIFGLMSSYASKKWLSTEKLQYFLTKGAAGMIALFAMVLIWTKQSSV